MMRVRNEHRRKYMGSEKFSWEEMRIALRDPKLYFSGLIQFCQDILLYGFSTFLPTILKGMGYNSLMSNVLTVPVYIWAASVFIAVAFCSDRYSKFASVRTTPVDICYFFTLTIPPVHLRNQHFRYHWLHSAASCIQQGSAILCNLPHRNRHLYRRRVECRMDQRECRSSVSTSAGDWITTDNGQLCWNCGRSNLS